MSVGNSARLQNTSMLTWPSRQGSVVKQDSEMLPGWSKRWLMEGERPESELWLLIFNFINCDFTV